MGLVQHLFVAIEGLKGPVSLQRSGQSLSNVYEKGTERRRTVEVGGGAPDDRCRSLVVVWGRRRTQRAAESFYHVKNL